MVDKPIYADVGLNYRASISELFLLMRKMIGTLMQLAARGAHQKLTGLKLVAVLVLASFCGMVNGGRELTGPSAVLG